MSQKHVHQIFRAALQAADPIAEVQHHVKISGGTLQVAGRKYRLSNYDRIRVIGAGKASARMALALETFGTRSWEQTLQPAIDIADGGMAVDWYATLKIASAARDLDQFDESRRIFLPGGHVPVGEWGGAVPRITLARLPQTLRRLAAAGPRDFYCGAIAEDIVATVRAKGSLLTMDDFAAHESTWVKPISTDFMGHEVLEIPPSGQGLTALIAMNIVSQIGLRRHAADSVEIGRAHV